MDKEKQIEEMAADIYFLLRSDMMSRAMASLLYDKGWYKQSAEKWIETDDENGFEFYRCSKCGCEQVGKSNYCPHCGSKMNMEE